MAERPATHSAGKGPIVFQSYSRADKAQAVRLASALQGAGRDVWWDASIEGGAEFAKTIEAAINTCDAVVVAWLKGLHLWFFSEFGNSVCEELGKGRTREQVLEGMAGFFKPSEDLAIVETAVEVMCPQCGASK